MSPRRRIRCRMCRQDLATQDHMLDHSQPSLSNFQTPQKALISSLASDETLVTLAQSSSSPTSSSHEPQLRLSNPNTPADDLEELGHTLSEKLSLDEIESKRAPLQPRIQLNRPTLVPPSNRPPVLPPNRGLKKPLGSSTTSTEIVQSNPKAYTSPPILSSSKCSGYFVEPMKWMGTELEQGHKAGKIVCPNQKCGAKLGNYDWAGVCCSCKEWVIPGFCIHRSKVDEII